MLKKINGKEISSSSLWSSIARHHVRLSSFIPYMLHVTVERNISPKFIISSKKPYWEKIFTDFQCKGCKRVIKVEASSSNNELSLEVPDKCPSCSHPFYLLPPNPLHLNWLHLLTWAKRTYLFLPKQRFLSICSNMSDYYLSLKKTSSRPNSSYQFCAMSQTNDKDHRAFERNTFLECSYLSKIQLHSVLEDQHRNFFLGKMMRTTSGILQKQEISEKYAIAQIFPPKRSFLILPRE